MDDNSTPLRAIHLINETLEPFLQLRGGVDVPAQLRLPTAFGVLINALRQSKHLLDSPASGYGLATLWWRRLVRECEAIESAAKEHTGDLGRLYFLRDGLFDWLRHDAGLVSAALTRMANGAINGPSVAGLLDGNLETGAIDRLRKLADDWEAEFADAPQEPGTAFAKREVLDAWQPWKERRSAIVNEAGRLALEAVNKNQVAAELYRDDRFADVLLRQLVLDYRNPGRGLIQQIGGADSPGGLRQLVDWLSGTSAEENAEAAPATDPTDALHKLIAERNAPKGGDRAKTNDGQPSLQKMKPPATISTEVVAIGDDRAGDGETNAAGLDRLTPAVKRAWASWKLAEANHAEILQDRAAYDWLNEQPDETFIGDLAGYELPAFATWQRYVREARKAVGESKNQSRAGRVAGSSVVKESEI